ncbi:MAG: nitrite reductase, partial [Methanomicrobiaceae archaeon]|nr:nitrite reductase [Methanomicrobiaceae archaeon]
MKTQFGIHTRGGVITERDADYATIRLRIPAGVLSAAQLRGIAEIAEKYGDGGVHLTMRQTIELPHVDPSLLEDIAAVLGENGTPLGAERDEVVNVMACPGLERCKYANVETIELAKRIDHLVFGKEMPVKVRISIAGCTYACGSPQLNEIGIVGRIRPLRIPGL